MRKFLRGVICVYCIVFILTFGAAVSLGDGDIVRGVEEILSTLRNWVEMTADSMGYQRTQTAESFVSRYNHVSQLLDEIERELGADCGWNLGRGDLSTASVSGVKIMSDQNSMNNGSGKGTIVTDLSGTATNENHGNLYTLNLGNQKVSLMTMPGTEVLKSIQIYPRPEWNESLNVMVLLIERPSEKLEDELNNLLRAIRDLKTQKAAVATNEEARQDTSKLEWLLNPKEVKAKVNQMLHPEWFKEIKGLLQMKTGSITAGKRYSIADNTGLMITWSNQTVWKEVGLLNNQGVKGNID